MVIMASRSLNPTQVAFSASGLSARDARPDIDDDDEESDSSDSQSDSSLSMTSDTPAQKRTRPRGVEKLCSLRRALNDLHQDWPLHAGILQAHFEVESLVDDAYGWLGCSRSINWHFVCSIVKQHVCRHEGAKAKSIKGEYDRATPEERAVIDDSKRRLLEVLDWHFTKARGDERWPRCVRVDRSYVQELPKHQSRALRKLQQIWKSSTFGFRTVAPNNFSIDEQQAHLCLELNALQKGSRSSAVICGRDASQAQKIINGLVEKYSSTSIGIDICCPLPDSWRHCLVLLTQSPLGIGDLRIEQHYSNVELTGFFLHGPLPIQCVITDALLGFPKDTPRRSSLIFVVSQKMSTIRTLRGSVLKEILAEFGKGKQPIPRASRLPSLASLLALSIQDSAIDTTELSQHLREQVAMAYACNSCRRIIVGKEATRAGIDSLMRGEIAAIKRGFHGDHRMKAAVLQSLQNGDPWLPLLSEDFYRLPGPSAFHGHSRPGHDKTEKDRLTFCFYFTAGGLNAAAGIKDQSVNLEERISSSPAPIARHWQFCAECAYEHLCTPVTKKPTCGCQVCAFESQVLNGEKSASLWRRGNVRANKRPPRSQARKVILDCPFCEADIE